MTSKQSCTTCGEPHYYGVYYNHNFVGLEQPSSNERAAFEAYILRDRGQDYLQRSDDGVHDYSDCFIQEAWEAWQARASAPPPARIAPDTPDNDMVICPQCTSQFVAIPVNVQKRLSPLPPPASLDDRMLILPAGHWSIDVCFTRGEPAGVLSFNAKRLDTMEQCECFSMAAAVQWLEGRLSPTKAAPQMTDYLPSNRVVRRLKEVGRLALRGGMVETMETCVAAADEIERLQQRVGSQDNLIEALRDRLYKSYIARGFAQHEALEMTMASVGQMRVSEPPAASPFDKAKCVFAGKKLDGYLLKLWFDTQEDLDAAFDVVEGDPATKPDFPVPVADSITATPKYTATPESEQGVQLSRRGPSDETPATPKRRKVRCVHGVHFLNHCKECD